jgi:PAS domain S-box-containing protein
MGQPVETGAIRAGAATGGQAMTVARWQARAVRLFRKPDTMLGQIRGLFLAFCLIWPVFGLFAIGARASTGNLWLAVVGALAAELWWCVGYRRQRFPAWSWPIEGFCVWLVVSASDFGTSVGFLFMWINLRALYGPVREKVFGGTVVAVMMAAGVLVSGRSPDDILPLLFTALMALVVNHVLSSVAGSRDRAAARERAVVAAGAGLVAATTRAEAMRATLAASVTMGGGGGGALIATVKGSTLRVVATAGRVDADADGRQPDLAALPGDVTATLTPGGFALLQGGEAAGLAGTFGLQPRAVVVLAPLAVRGDVFGLLVLALDQYPPDDLSAAMTTLADEAALTLDQLLIRSRLSVVVEYSPDALVLASEAGAVRFVNPAAEALLGCPASELIGRDLRSLLHPADVTGVLRPSSRDAAPIIRPCRIRGRDIEEWTEVEMIVEQVTEHDGSRSLVLNARDVSERHRLELELRHAQKLESVGRLAAGIAHEINTPIQFVGDNVRFLRDAFADLHRLYEAYRELAAVVGTSTDPAQALREVEAVAKDVDIDFALEEVPEAIVQTLEGISRVANIVRAMKAFGHPGTDEMAPADLNDAIANTLVVANNELKYVADVESDLSALPLVRCHLGDVNQVVLNLVVNAAHAIASAGRGRGTVRVATRVDGGHVVIEVTDTGTGMPPEVAEKVFDPFFTTKEVGTGTGQGLALVRSLVVDRHGGAIDFTTEPGVGTTFTVRLPLTDGAVVPLATPELTGAVR